MVSRKTAVAAVGAGVTVVTIGYLISCWWRRRKQKDPAAASSSLFVDGDDGRKGADDDVSSAAGAAGVSKRKHPPNLSQTDTLDNLGKSGAPSEMERGDTADLTPLEAAKRLKERGNKFFKVAKYDEAVKMYSQAIAQCPADETEALCVFYNNRATAYDKMEKFAEAIEDCSKSLSLNKRYLKGYYRRAKSSLALKNYQRSLIDAFSGFMLSEGKNDECMKLFDASLKELAKQSAADRYKDRSYRPPSKSTVEQSYATFPNDPIKANLTKYATKDINNASPFELACDQLVKKQYDNIVTLCDEELENPDSEYTALATLLRGSFKQMGGKGTEAEKDFNTLICLPELDQRIRSTAYIKKYTIELERGNPQQALDFVESAIKIDEDNGDIYRMRSQFHMLFDKLQECLDDMKKACDLTPDDPMCRVELTYMEYIHAQASRNPVQLQSAFEKFKQLREEYPKCSEVSLLYAQALIQMERLSEANQVYEEARVQFPESSNVMIAQARLFQTWKNDGAAALELMREAKKLDNDSEMVCQMLGQYYMSRDQIDEALHEFEQAAQLAETELKLCQICSMIETLKAQRAVKEELGISSGNILQKLMMQ